MGFHSEHGRIPRTYTHSVTHTLPLDHDALEAEMPVPTQNPVPLDSVEDADDREALKKMRARFPQADPITRLAGKVPPTKIPRHIAVIMDGNGRWAQQRGMERTEGHIAGIASVEHTLREATCLGVEYLTLYSFSTENWKRPEAEVEALMELYALYMAGVRDKFVSHDVRLHQIGRRDRFSANALRELERTLEATAECKSINLVLAVDYSSRDEITRAVTQIATDTRSGALDPNTICEDTVSSYLDTHTMPDPDLLIRTGGDMRLSNYLLWQLSYAEIYSTDVYWPDFRARDLHRAIEEFASRERRFGALSPTA